MLRKLAIFGFALLAMAAAAGIYFSPYLALSRMRDAAAAGDTEELSTYVDYPQLRENLKTELAERITRTGTGNTAPFAALGATFGRALMDPLIDAMVTPQGLALLLAGVIPERQAARNEEPGTFPEPEMSYRNWNQFEVRFEPEGLRPGLALVLQRSGLADWKLTHVELP